MRLLVVPGLSCGAAWVASWSAAEAQPVLLMGLLLCWVPFHGAFTPARTARMRRAAAFAGLSFLALLAQGVSVSSSGAGGLVLLVWWLGLEALRQLGGGLGYAVALAGAGSLLTLPCWWPDAAISAKIAMFLPHAWGLGTVLGADWQRAPGFYELVGDRYCPTPAATDAWAPISVVLGLLLMARLTNRLRRLSTGL